MEMSITCPLCSQPGFPDVNALWLTLVRATTRQLSCPVCQEVLSGLDKLTIHLVSHSLHDQLVQGCLTTNSSSASAILDKNQDMQGSSLTASQETMQAADNETKVVAPVASYVLINFPMLENVSIENRDQVSAFPCVDANGAQSGKSVPSSSSQDINFSAISSSKDPNLQEISFTAFVSPNPSNIALAPNRSLMSPHIQASDGCESLKFITLPQPVYGDRNVATDILPAIKGDKPLMTEILSLGSPPQCIMQSQGDQNDHTIHEVSSVHTKVSQFTSNKIVIEKCHLQSGGLTRSCSLCGLSFKDDNIASLHQQLVHNLTPGDAKFYQLSPKHDDQSLCFKQLSKRVTTASRSGDATSPLHKFPCHICNKVFRMRGSLMVHLRVAHSPRNAVGLASRLGSSSNEETPTGDVMCKLSLQALSTEEAKASQLSGESGYNLGNTEKRMNDDTSFVQNNTAHASPTSTNIKKQTDPQSFVAVSVKSPKLSPTQSPSAQPASTESFGAIFPCNLCNKTFSKDTLLTQHLKSHESKQWECDVCFKSFTTKYFLKKHKRLHTGEMPYTCGICNKSFTFQQSYHKHLLYHSDEKPHSCNECGRAFKELSTLHNHQRIHTGEKPWACETCGKCFRQRVSYLVHRRIHTGAMPYQCTVCLKSFRYKVSQRTHKCVAQPVGDVPFQSNDLLQQLLQTPGKEVESTIAVQTQISATVTEPSSFLKEQQLNIKQEHHHLKSTNIFMPSKESIGNHFLVGPQSDRLMSLKECNQLEDQATPPQSVDSQVSSNASQDRIFNEFFPLQAARGEEASKVVSLNSTKLSTNYNLDKEEFEASADSHTQSTPPPPADLNIDLLQDILSMVMSPTSENAPSPSTQMRHLSLSGGQHDDDLAAGLELRRLLYGSCDSESTL